MPGFDLHYSVEGAGTAMEPVVVGFSFTRHFPSLEELRAQLPGTVTLEPGPIAGGYRMRGVNPSLTRVEILRIFDQLKRDNSWTGKHQA
jgi:hypothetical protein